MLHTRLDGVRKRCVQPLHHRSTFCKHAPPSMIVSSVLRVRMLFERD